MTPLQQHQELSTRGNALLDLLATILEYYSADTEEKQHEVFHRLQAGDQYPAPQFERLPDEHLL